nr:MAG TPA: hypothetical protein [Caudoviricetes sp.]
MVATNHTDKGVKFIVACVSFRVPRLRDYSMLYLGDRFCKDIRCQPN